MTSTPPTPLLSWTRSIHLLCLVMALGSMCLLNGCAALAAVGSAIPVTVHAEYAGLAGHSVGVLVWADRGVLIDWGTIQLDLATSVQNKLQGFKADEVKGVSWPWPPQSIVKYMRDHPSAESTPAVDIAPNLQVDRLIYIEVQSFRTRAESALELFRGSANLSLSVIEVSGGKGKVAYSKENIQATFPDKVPTDGLPGLGDSKVYYGTIDALSDEIVKKLVTHEEDRK